MHRPAFVLLLSIFVSSTALADTTPDRRATKPMNKFLFIDVFENKSVEQYCVKDDRYMQCLGVDIRKNKDRCIELVRRGASECKQRILSVMPESISEKQEISRFAYDFSLCLAMNVATVAGTSVTDLNNCLAAKKTTTQNRFRNYEATGNLESKYNSGCVGIQRLSNKHTPADLYKAVTSCVEEGKYKEGALIYALAGVYGRFDTLRVADNTAHQAITVLRLSALSPVDKTKQNAFKDVLNKTLGNSEGFGSTCKDIAQIGPPDYYPRYMIQHGMGAFLKNGSEDGLIPNFDSKAAWKRSLGGYLHCPDL
jgi:hypothetical protein